MRNFLNLVGRFGADERGVFGVIFAVMAIVIVAFSGAVVDYVSVQQAKTRAQVALDAAALALQPKIYSQTEEQVRTAADQLLIERLADPTIAASVTSAAFDKVNGRLDLRASVTTQTAFVRLVGVSSLTASLLSEATKGALNIEVALALDTTGSMKGQKILDLQTATNSLIDIVVKDVQTPTYSKLALIPYSMGVNVGTYADAVRGPIIAPKAITNVQWLGTKTATISGATKANPIVVTANSHGFANNDWIYITGSNGMTNLNETPFQVTNVSTNSFSLKNLNGNNVNSSQFKTFSGTATARRCLNSRCTATVTANGHGFSNGDRVQITSVGGVGNFNDSNYAISSVSANTFIADGSAPTGTYTSGGNAYCMKSGCEYYYFTNASGGNNTNKVSTCVSERTTNAYTDDAPSTTYLGRNYPDSGNPCIAQTIVPLSTDKVKLHATANGLKAEGSTGGHIGLAWGWYMISPKFAYLWPSASQPAENDAPNTLKAIILMTDGAFNSPYCDGVIAKNAGTGSGGDSTHINCNAPNGDSWTQGQAQCSAMKAQGISVYTVGFDIASDVNAQNLMRQCATDPSYFYLASNGAQLNAAFTNIAERISALRVSR